MDKTVVIRMTPELYEKVIEIKQNLTWVQLLETIVEKNKKEEFETIIGVKK
jgi:hypothetical protein